MPKSKACFWCLGVMGSLGFLLQHQSVMAGSMQPIISGVMFQISQTLPVQPSSNEVIKNGSFDTSLSDWRAQGDVSVIETVSLGNSEKPTVLQLGGYESRTTLSHQWLKQDIELSNHSPEYLTFWYSVETTEVDPGFDEIVLAVTFDDVMVFEVSSTELSQDHEQRLGYSPWQQVVLKLPGTQSQTDTSHHELAFFAGNTGDDLFSPRVYLDDITTVQPAELLSQLEAPQHSIQEPLTIQADPAYGTSVTLHWFTPQHEIPASLRSLYRYEVRYAQNPDELRTKEWQQLASAQPRYFDDVPGKGWRHLKKSQTAEMVDVTLPDTGQYYLALRIIGPNNQPAVVSNTIVLDL